MPGEFEWRGWDDPRLSQLLFVAVVLVALMFGAVSLAAVWLVPAGSVPDGPAPFVPLETIGPGDAALTAAAAALYLHAVLAVRAILSRRAWATRWSRRAVRSFPLTLGLAGLASLACELWMLAAAALVVAVGLLAFARRVPLPGDHRFIFR